jgi:hypothetical protein
MLLGLLARWARGLRQIWAERDVTYINAQRFGGWRRGE